MRFRIEASGDAWFWDRPAVEVDVVAQAWGHSRLYYKVRLEPPVVRQGPGGSAPSASSPVICRAAWISSRWVGHEIASLHDTSALLWLIGEQDEAVPPSADSPFSARVACRPAGFADRDPTSRSEESATEDRSGEG